VSVWNGLCEALSYLARIWNLISNFSGKLLFIVNRDWLIFCIVRGISECVHIISISKNNTIVSFLNLLNEFCQDYGNVAPIPVACITIEDAEMLQRWQDRGNTKISLKCFFYQTFYFPNMSIVHRIIKHTTWCKTNRMISHKKHLFYKWYLRISHKKHLLNNRYI